MAAVVGSSWDSYIRIKFPGALHDTEMTDCRWIETQGTVPISPKPLPKPCTRLSHLPPATASPPALTCLPAPPMTRTHPLA